ncbi:hypothetical protein PPYR_13964 [Photinus pyralis]|uniref:Uncharacterized protein n=1 Tax=Photinus pyralis TaxID=7054 RepID=A0A5N4A3V6_PHOPY|nr:uncharacterized protein LOC116180229 [Photinus pyralis]KAB0792003.1 hypothetical protein PPYR_13964 [Photinus pyralis]
MEKNCANVFFVVVFLVLMNEVVEGNAGTESKDFQPFVSECICATNADPDEVDLWMKYRTYLPSPSSCFKCFLKCVSSKVPFTNADGTPDLDFATKHFGGSISIDQVFACMELQDKNLDPCDKTYQFSKCIDEFIYKNTSSPIGE